MSRSCTLFIANAERSEVSGGGGGEEEEPRRGTTLFIDVPAEGVEWNHISTDLEKGSLKVVVFGCLAVEARVFTFDDEAHTQALLFRVGSLAPKKVHKYRASLLGLLRSGVVDYCLSPLFINSEKVSRSDALNTEFGENEVQWAWGTWACLIRAVLLFFVDEAPLLNRFTAALAHSTRAARATEKNLNQCINRDAVSLVEKWSWEGVPVWSMLDAETAARFVSEAHAFEERVEAGNSRVLYRLAGNDVAAYVHFNEWDPLSEDVDLSELHRQNVEHLLRKAHAFEIACGGARRYVPEQLTAIADEVVLRVGFRDSEDPVWQLYDQFEDTVEKFGESRLFLYTLGHIPTFYQGALKKARMASRHTRGALIVERLLYTIWAVYATRYWQRKLATSREFAYDETSNEQFLEAKKVAASANIAPAGFKLRIDSVVDEDATPPIGLTPMSQAAEESPIVTSVLLPTSQELAAAAQLALLAKEAGEEQSTSESNSASIVPPTPSPSRAAPTSEGFVVARSPLLEATTEKSSSSTQKRPRSILQEPDSPVDKLLQGRVDEALQQRMPRLSKRSRVVASQPQLAMYTCSERQHSLRIKELQNCESACYVNAAVQLFVSAHGKLPSSIKAKYGDSAWEVSKALGTPHQSGQQRDVEVILSELMQAVERDSYEHVMVESKCCAKCEEKAEDISTRSTSLAVDFQLKRRVLTLQQAVDAIFSEQEDLEYLCNKCRLELSECVACKDPNDSACDACVLARDRFFNGVQSYRYAKRWASMRVHPQRLVIFGRRFRSNASGSKSSRLSHRTEPEAELHVDGASYALVAVACHEGSRLEDGHWVAYVRDGSNKKKWIKCDDARIHSAEMHSFEKGAMRRATHFVYELESK